MRPREGHWEVAQSSRQGKQLVVAESVEHVAVSYWSGSRSGSVELWVIVSRANRMSLGCMRALTQGGEDRGDVWLSHVGADHSPVAIRGYSVGAILVVDARCGCGKEGVGGCVAR